MISTTGETRAYFFIGFYRLFDIEIRLKLKSPTHAAIQNTLPLLNAENCKPISLQNNHIYSICMCMGYIGHENTNTTKPMELQKTILFYI